MTALAPQLVGQAVDQLGEAVPGPVGSRACGREPSLRIPRAIDASASAPEPLEHEVDGVADGLDLGRLLLGDA